jgi:hypothetical protein
MKLSADNEFLDPHQVLCMYIIISPWGIIRPEFSVSAHIWFIRIES